MTRAEMGYRTMVAKAIEFAASGNVSESAMCRASAYALYLYAGATTAHVWDCDETRIEAAAKVAA